MPILTPMPMLMTSFSVCQVLLLQPILEIHLPVSVKDTDTCYNYNTQTHTPELLIVTISANTHIVHTSMHIEKKTAKICEIMQYVHKDWWGQKEASNQQKLYTILLALAKESLKIVSVAWSWTYSKCVTCVCLQCGTCKQNCYHFLGKTTSIDKRAVNLRVITIAFLIGQSLVNILSQIPAHRQMQTKLWQWMQGHV